VAGYEDKLGRSTQMYKMLQAESRQILTSQIASIAELGAEISDSGKKLKLQVRRNRFAIFLQC